MIMLTEISVATKKRLELRDITPLVEAVVREKRVESGICVVFCPHTTAALTVNENADPSVVRDISDSLSGLIPEDRKYAHLEGNSDAHIKAVLTGPSLSLIVQNGRIVLGRWQGLFLCEYDGPRNRQLWVQVVPSH